MYAVIRAGGKQYRVAPGDVIEIDSALPSQKGRVQFEQVLAVSAEPGQIVRPNGGGASVSGQVLDEGRADKIIVFKFKRKKQYKKKQGHRQAQTRVRILEIAFDGKKETAPEQPTRKVKAKPVAETAEEATSAARSAAPKKKAAKKTAAKKTAAKKAAPKKKK
jgi:large subunit ribosomal protein L21